jgi:hypothetical protein
MLSSYETRTGKNQFEREGCNHLWYSATRTMNIHKNGTDDDSIINIFDQRWDETFAVSH